MKLSTLGALLLPGVVTALGQERDRSSIAGNSSAFGFLQIAGGATSPPAARSSSRTTTTGA